MKTEDICFMCGASATTDDHIPPRSIFPKPRPGNLITLRACGPCNTGTKLDDEYFRDFCLTGIDEASFPKAMALSLEKIDQINNDPKKFKYWVAQYKSLRRVNLITEAGLWAGKAGAREFDIERIKRTITKFIYALHFRHFGIRIPDEMEVSIFHEREMLEEEAFILMSPTLANEPQRIGDGAFTYRYGRLVDDERFTVWGLSFYETHHFLGMTSLRDESQLESGNNVASAN